MSDLKLPRLLAAAKEFNVGQDTLIDFLEAKGFGKDDLKPTSKLTEEMYRCLQQEFQSDKVAKLKSDQIDLPKGSVEAKKKKEEDAVVFKKETKKEAEEEKPKEEVVVAPVVVEQKPEVIVEKKVEEVVVPEVVKVEAPEIEGLKVLDKIDLSAIDSSTRPKKIVKKKAEAAPAEQAPVPEEKEKPKAKKKKQEAEEVIAAPVVEVKPEVEAVQEEEGPAVIENITAEKLEGPKILGKIELPVESDTRPKPGDEKRKRKRIPIEKKDFKPSTTPELFKRKDGEAPRQGGGGGGQQGGGFRGGNRPGGPQRGPARGPREVKEIDEKEIQNKIRETQAKLAGTGGRGKSLKAKYRREKRQGVADQAGSEDSQDNKLQLTEFISVSELANLMDVSFAEVISKCMSLGLMVSINQRLDAEVIELVASEFGFDVEFIDMEKQMEMEEEEEEDSEEDLVPRAPIVTIMGHVDHGKTSLLDYIRSANVVAGEAGGITQHIGAYEVTLANGKKIAFLDTPGHEAFTAMRARGAKVTDVAIIVIAADDNVMPQTIEAINHAQAANVPMVFAINKVDKPDANPERIKEQLAKMNILVEDWGGKYQCQEISAKKGMNVEALLEKVLLEAELLELKANANRRANGTVIESMLDKGRGYVMTVLIQGGTLHVGDVILAGCYSGRVKALFNERGFRIKEAGPAAPAQVLGMTGAPQAGDLFNVMEDEREARDIANKRLQLQREQGIRTQKHITLDEIGRRLAIGNFKELNVIVKGDVDGSIEALADSLLKLSTPEIQINIIHKSVGAITESDVLLASASNAIIIGFQVRPSVNARKLAETEQIEIRLYSIIYDAINELKAAMEGMLAPEFQEKIVGNIEIRDIFKIPKVGTIAGCMVLDGKVSRNTKVRVVRDGIVVFSGELASLKRFKDDVKEVSAGYECGLSVHNFQDLKVGDVIEGYEQVAVKRTLA